MSFIDIEDKLNIAVIGDSITFIGKYIDFIKNHLDKLYPDNKITFYNYGISGETLSGLCEKDRPTPRSCLFNRIDSILHKLACADLFVFCYGMNDGIYEQYSKSHMDAYKNGVIHLNDILRVFDKPIISLTPPPFDEISYFHTLSLQPPLVPSQPEYPIAYRGYDDVLKKYSDWLKKQKGILMDDVIDIHTPIKAFIKNMRVKYPTYIYGDGIHPPINGHYMMAKYLLKAITGDEMPDAINKHTLA